MDLEKRIMQLLKRGMSVKFENYSNKQTKITVQYLGFACSQVIAEDQNVYDCLLALEARVQGR